MVARAGDDGVLGVVLVGMGEVYSFAATVGVERGVCGGSLDGLQGGVVIVEWGRLASEAVKESER